MELGYLSGRLGTKSPLAAYLSAYQETMAAGGFGQPIVGSSTTSDLPKHTERSTAQGQASHSGSAEQMTSHTRRGARVRAAQG